MRIKRRVGAACAALVAAVALAACSSTSAPKAVAPSHHPMATATSTTNHPTQSPTVQTAPAPAGIVLATCLRSTNEEELDFVDPTSVQVTSRYFPYGNYNTQGVCNTNYRWVQRSAYNGTFTLLAANMAVQNDGYHAGVLRVAKNMQDMTPNFTDLSALSGGDGFSATPQQTAGAFGPDGMLYFVQRTPAGAGNPDTVQLMKVDPNGGIPQPVPASSDVNSVAIGNPTDVAPSTGVYFVPGYSKPLFSYDAPLIVAPDGSWGFWYDGNTDSIRDGVPGTTGTELDADSVTPRISPMIYVNKTTYIGIGLDSTKLVRVTVNGSNTTNTSLLPLTDGLIGDPTLSPDHMRIAFILTKDTTASLYTVSIAGGQPTKVEDLNSGLDQEILDWTSPQ